MKLTIEDNDFRVRDGHKKVSYGEVCDLCTVEDWDLIFQHLKIYIEELKLKKVGITNIGITIDIDSKINKLESLLKKYVKFVEIAEDSRFNDL